MFWTSPVPKENVLLVNSSEKFVQGRVGETLRGAALVGLDAEWRPSHLAKELQTPPRISILQVACRMREQLSTATWQELREDGSGAATPASSVASHVDEAWDPLSTASEPILGADGLVNQSHLATLTCVARSSAPATVSPSGSLSSLSHVNGEQACAPHQEKKPVASSKARRRKAKGKAAGRKEGSGGPLNEVVFILDMIHLDPQLVLPTLASLFNDPAILKLGFSFRDDLRMIQSSYAPSTTLSQCLQVHPYIDVGSMYAQMRKKKLLGGSATSSQPQPRTRRQRRSASVLPSPSHSLSSLTDHLLGRPLNKQWQCSDWEQRPLTPEQLQYAADDAACLLHIFDKLVTQHPLKPNALTPPSESPSTAAESLLTTPSTVLAPSSSSTEQRSAVLSHTLPCTAMSSTANSTPLFSNATLLAATETALSSTAASRGVPHTLATASGTPGDRVTSTQPLQMPEGSGGVSCMLSVQAPMGVGHPSSGGAVGAHPRPGLLELACTCRPAGAAGGPGVEGHVSGVPTSSLEGDARGQVEAAIPCGIGKGSSNGTLRIEGQDGVEPSNGTLAIEGHNRGESSNATLRIEGQDGTESSNEALRIEGQDGVSRGMHRCSACMQQAPESDAPGALVRVPGVPARTLALASLAKAHQDQVPARMPAPGGPASPPPQASEPGQYSAAAGPHAPTASCPNAEDLSALSSASGDSKLAEEAPSARVAALYSNRLALGGGGAGGGGRGGGGGGRGGGQVMHARVPVQQNSSALGATSTGSAVSAATVATAPASADAVGPAGRQPAATEDRGYAGSGTPSRVPRPKPGGGKKGAASTDKAASSTDKATASTDEGPKAPFTTENGSKAPAVPRERRSQKTEVAKLDASLDGWAGPAPWEIGPNADNCPRFLCDIMVEGLARQLRCVGIDAASPPPMQPQGPRQLVEWAESEGRVLLTRDSKFLRRRLLPPNYTYRVVNKAKQDQLKEVLETFGLRVSEEQLLTRCVRCNGDFITTPLTAEEAISCAPQSIPPCVRENVSEFWKCSKCGHLYWEGSQFDRAVKQFGSVCRHLKSKRELILKSILPGDPPENERPLQDMPTGE